MTREHVFARWLVRQVHGARLLVSDAPAEGTAAPTRIARVTADVCAECNAGWMSTLEVSFRQAVFARPRIGVLWAPDRTTLSRWFTKTAVVLAHARDGALITRDVNVRAREAILLPLDELDAARAQLARALRALDDCAGARA